MEPVRFGIIGCGVVGNTHIRMGSQSPKIKVAAVADVREQQARETAAKYNVPKVYLNADELIADPEIEAVVLALPANVRLELGLKVLAAGKHLLTEKPPGMNVGEVKQLIKARKGKQLAAACSSRSQGMPHFEPTRQLIASGALGDIRLVRARVAEAVGLPPVKPPPVWRVSKALNGGGFLVNWGIYDLDYLLALMSWQLKPEMILARTWPVPAHLTDRVAPGSDAECYFAYYMTCAGGIAFTHERGQFMSTHTDAAWEIVGTRGSVRLHLHPIDGKKIIHDEGTADRGVISTTIWEGNDHWDMLNSFPDEDFATAIRERREPATSLKRALMIQKITDAVYASAESGKPVRVK